MSHVGSAAIPQPSHRSDESLQTCMSRDLALGKYSGKFSSTMALSSNIYAISSEPSHHWVVGSLLRATNTIGCNILQLRSIRLSMEGDQRHRNSTKMVRRLAHPSATRAGGLRRRRFLKASMHIDRNRRKPQPGFYS